MKTIEVVAAVICDNKQILATQKGYGDFEGLWEFPGGKVESGENLEDAIIREIREELSCTISVIKRICTVYHTYPQFELVMHCFDCEISYGKLQLIEHKSARWLGLNELDSLNWLPADLEVVKALKDYYRNKEGVSK